MDNVILEDNELTYKEIEKRVDRFCHDAFFHYLVIHNEGLRLMLCQKMVPERRLVEAVIVNGELYGRFYDHKKYVLDILAKDELGYHYNLEMQCGDITREDMIRFQCYGFRVADEEARKGKGYDNVKGVRQMIINAGKPLSDLKEYIHHFKYYDEKNKVRLPHNISDIYIVQLEKLVMDKMEKIEDFDELMYLFQNDEIYDKIEVDSKIREAIFMHEDYMISKERIAAIQRERDEWARNAKERTNLRKATEQGLQQGLQKGIQQGLQQGILKQTKVMIVNYVKTRFNEDISVLLKDISEDKLYLLENNIFKLESLEEIKELLK